MADVEIQIEGADAIVRDLGKVWDRVQHPRRALHRIGARVKDTAQLYAPISPSQSQKNALKKTKRKGKKKKSATTRAKPGSLQNSVHFRTVSNDSVKVHVPSNSPAGKYAYKMHEEKGQTWHERGVGTVAKGAQADDKFIERAIRDKEPDIAKIIDDETTKGTFWSR